MENMKFRDCVCKENKIIFFSELESVPVTIDIKKCISNVLLEKIRNVKRKSPFDLITELNGKIYALEMSGQYMCEYSLETNEISYIKIDCNKKIDGNFALLTTESNQVFIFDRFVGLTIYDTQSKNVKKISYPSSDCEIITGCKYKDNYFLFPKEGNKVFQYDISSEKWTTIYLTEKWSNLIHAAVDEEHILLLLEDGTIIKWDTKEDISIINDIKEWYQSNRAVSRICITKDSYIILPSLAEDILIFDKEIHEIKVMSDYPNDFKYVNNNWAKYYGYCETEDSYIFACRKSDYILKINKSDDGFEWIKSEIQLDKLLKCMKENEINIIEKKGYLNYFIKSDFIKKSKVKYNKIRAD